MKLEEGPQPFLLGKRENGRVLFLLRSYLPVYVEVRVGEYAGLSAGVYELLPGFFVKREKGLAVNEGGLPPSLYGKRVADLSIDRGGLSLLSFAP